jgi:hypothetical protein
MGERHGFPRYLNKLSYDIVSLFVLPLCYIIIREKFIRYLPSRSDSIEDGMFRRLGIGYANMKREDQVDYNLRPHG